MNAIQSIMFIINMEVHEHLYMKIGSRAGMIRSADVSIRIWYEPCWYDTYMIRYTCTWRKVSKSRILDFNNKVNVLGWSIQWIQQILVLKQNDYLCSVYHSFIHKVLVQHNWDQTKHALVFCLIVWKLSVKWIVWGPE